MKRLILIFISLVMIVGELQAALVVGAERLDIVAAGLEGKRVGLIINHTSVVGPRQICLLDTLLSRGIDVKKVFAPEHGFRGDADAGEIVSSGVDVKTGIPIISLYGSNKRPSQAQLSDVDVVVFDIQDVGARFYTYISTMFYAMQACAQYDVDFVVLDRPNPNDYIDGPIISDNLKSFVGALPIPILHALTVGELAQMINGQGWIGSRKVDLSVVPMLGWSHGQPYELPIKPSPNLPNAQSVALYASLCLFEATDVSVGRGTREPFQVLGYPDARYGSYTFTPEPLEGFDKNPLQKGKKCYGLDLRSVQPPVGLTLKYFIDYMKLSGRGIEFISKPRLFDMLAGDSELKNMLADGMTEQQIKQTWAEELDEYRAMRRKYLLYFDPRASLLNQ